MGDEVMNECYRLLDKEVEVDVSFRQLEEASYLAWGLEQPHGLLGGQNKSQKFTIFLQWINDKFQIWMCYTFLRFISTKRILGTIQVFC